MLYKLEKGTGIFHSFNLKKLRNLYLIAIISSLSIQLFIGILIIVGLAIQDISAESVNYAFARVALPGSG